VVFDSGGNLVLSVTENLPAGPAAVAVDISLLRQGIYFYQIVLTLDDGSQQHPSGGRFSVIH
jgi:hypothetical protein